MVSRHKALAREDILEALTAYTGVTTADGATPANNTLIDTMLIGKNDFITGKTILIGPNSNAAYEDQGASVFNNVTGQITVAAAYSAQILQGTLFRVLNVAPSGLVTALLNAIKAKTDLIPATPADQATSLLIKAQTDKIPAFEHEVEWTSTPVSQQVASAAATNLTAGTITPTFPAGSTLVRAILIASIHAANQAANTHHISLKVQGQKAGGGYADRLDLTAQPTLGLVNVDGASDSWVGSVDVTALVDTSAVAYDFRFVVDSDNAGAVNYTTLFLLALVYKI